MKVLVTGANGFVGRAVWLHLNAMNGVQAVASVRRLDALTEAWASVVSTGELSAQTDWSQALAGIDAVVHAAARVHVMNDRSLDPLSEFRRVNVGGTAALVRQAAARGVRRFIFLSSIKVNGESTERGKKFTSDDVPAPRDSYGISKYEAEQLIRQVSIETGMEVVIIRPPLVYGPGVKANFQTMVRCVARGVPLPLAAVTKNRRSFVALDNLIDLIATCVNHPCAINRTLLVSDGEDLSTAELIERLGVILGRPARLFYMPTDLIKLGANIVNKSHMYERVCGSLQMDITATQELLQWSPPLSVDEGLHRALEGFRV
jgi:nucleoside-diphosphate-sugar epimerase